MDKFKWITPVLLAVLIGGSWYYLTPTEKYDVCRSGNSYGSWENVTETVYVNDRLSAVGKYRCDLEDSELWCGKLSGGKRTWCYYILDEVDISILDKFELKSGGDGISIKPNYTELILNRWGEDYLKIRRDAAGKAAFKDGKVEWQDENEIMRIYETGNGVEFEIILKEHPKANVFEFEIEDSGFNFYYQPPLDEEMNNVSCNATDCQGNHRPENVVGSYAVYHKYKKNNEYMTGKAFHIFRPKIIDANNDLIYADMNITENVLTITIDEKWLENAKYPVMVDPTIGYTSKGASFDEFMFSENPYGTDYSYRLGNVYAGVEGTLDYFNANIESDDMEDDKTGTTYVFVNEKDSQGTGSHGQIATNSTDITYDGSASAWYTFTLNSEEISSGTDYVLSITADPNDFTISMSYASLYLWYDTDGSIVTYEVYDDEVNIDNPFEASDSENNIFYSIYVNYTAAGDTCSCPASGNWDMDCGDGCIVTDACDMMGNNVSMSGPGTVNIQAKIYNYTYWQVSGGCHVIEN